MFSPDEYRAWQDKFNYKRAHSTESLYGALVLDVAVSSRTLSSIVHGGGYSARINIPICFYAPSLSTDIMPSGLVAEHHPLVANVQAHVAQLGLLLVPVNTWDEAAADSKPSICNLWGLRRYTSRDRESRHATGRCTEYSMYRCQTQPVILLMELEASARRFLGNIGCENVEDLAFHVMELQEGSRGNCRRLKWPCSMYHTSSSDIATSSGRVGYRSKTCT